MKERGRGGGREGGDERGETHLSPRLLDGVLEVDPRSEADLHRSLDRALDDGEDGEKEARDGLVGDQSPLGTAPGGRVGRERLGKERKELN